MFLKQTTLQINPECNLLPLLHHYRKKEHMPIMENNNAGKVVQTQLYPFNYQFPQLSIRQFYIPHFTLHSIRNYIFHVYTDNTECISSDRTEVFISF